MEKQPQALKDRKGFTGGEEEEGIFGLKEGAEGRHREGDVEEEAASSPRGGDGDTRHAAAQKASMNTE